MADGVTPGGIRMGNNVHIFARPELRDAWRSLFETILHCEVATVAHPGMEEPMLVVRFAEGGAISIEFTAEAEDGDEPRLGTWLELRASEPGAVIDAIERAGLRQVAHPGHPFYFLAPGGQVFTVVQAST